jgi:CTP:molybdopterin cytidylyltransferase MocA
MGIPAIVLAAGASSRLGRPKQLVEYQGETLLMRAIRLALEGGANPVLVVLGANFEQMILGVQHSGAIPLINDRWAEGIAGSIHVGIRALDVNARGALGALLLTCDQPRLTAAHLAALLGEFSSPSQAAIVASSYGGVLGTPAVFPSNAFAKLLALRGDTGARAILKTPPGPVVEVPFPGGEFDIDTPADLDALT